MLSRDYETPALIASAISQGDKFAEGVLYKKYFKSTLYLLERKTGDPELAQDLCHEAFCVLLERLRSSPLDDPEKLLGFLHSIAINLQIADFRKNRRRNTVTDQTIIDVVADPSQNLYRQLLQERTGQAVRQVIASMDNPRDKKLLYGFYIQEKEKAEICDELQLSLRHFDKVLYRAKQRFRDLVTAGQSK